MSPEQFLFSGSDWMTIVIAINFAGCVLAALGWLYVISVFFDAINAHFVTRFLAWGFLAFLIGCSLVNLVSLFADCFKIFIPYIIPSRGWLQMLIWVLFVVVFGFVYSNKDVFKSWSLRFRNRDLSL